MLNLNQNTLNILKIPTITTAALLGLLLSGCTKIQSVILPFHLTYHNESVDCLQFPQLLPSTTMTLQDFRFYLHDIELQNSSGRWTAMALEQGGQWQHDSTVLLDFENARGDCKLGNRESNNQITGTIKNDDYQAIRFKIGIPFALNHQNPLTAKAPLNQSSMHWHWQAGYKFIRAEFAFNKQPRRLHLGSLRCKGEVGNVTHCEQPNRVQITLNGFTLNKTPVTVSLDQLLDATDPDDKSHLTCMGDTEHPWCNNAMKWLGFLADEQKAFLIAEEKQ